MTIWKTQLEGGAADVLGSGNGSTPTTGAGDVKALHAKIGQLTLVKDLSFGSSAHQGGIAERKAMIDRDHELSVTRQAELVGIAWSTVYHPPRR